MLGACVDVGVGVLSAGACHLKKVLKVCRRNHAVGAQAER